MEDLSALLASLEAASAPAAALDAVVAAGRSRGFARDDLSEVVRVACSPSFGLGAKERARLLRCALPSGDVPGSVFASVLGAMGTFPRQLQRVAFAFLVLVLDHVPPSEERVPRALYGAVFHYLDHDALRPHVCHLLFRLTRRRDAKPFRAQRVRRIAQKYAGEKWTEALAALYADFEGGGGAAPPPRGAASFRPVDRKWRADLAAVRGRAGGAPAAAAKRPATFSAPEAAPAKRARVVAGLPEARARVAPTIHRAARRIPLQDVGGPAGLVRALPRLRLPAQMSGVLSSRAMQQWLALVPRPDAVRRVDDWLSRFVASQAPAASGGGGGGADARRELLRVFRSASAALGEAPPAAEEYAVQALAAQSPGDGCDEDLLDVLAHARPRPFEALHEDVLRPLVRAATCAAPEFKARAVAAHSRIFMSWWRLGPAALGGAGGAAHLVFGPAPAGVDYYKALFHLARHADEFAALSMAADGAPPVVAHAALAMHEALARLGRGEGPGPVLPFVVPPSEALLFACVSCADPSVVSRACGVLVDYRPVYLRLREEEARAAESSSSSSSSSSLPTLNFKSGADTKDSFNAFVYDTNNALWRGRLVAPRLKNTESRITAGADPLRLKAVPGAAGCLAVTQSAAFGSLAAQFVASRGRGESPSELSPEARRDLVLFLRDRGFDGFYRFLCLFNKSFSRLDGGGGGAAASPAPTPSSTPRGGGGSSGRRRRR